MKRALILVDLQNDFVAPGALPVPAGIEVVAFANAVMPNYQLVVATQDWHPADHLSFASQHPELRVGQTFLLNGLPQIAWPDHCVQGSEGAKLIEGLAQNGIQKIFQKGTDRELDSYSGFFDNGHQKETGMGVYLTENDVTDVDVMGLATDYCVRYTTLDAIQLGFRTRVLLRGCRGVELAAGDIDQALAEMARAGVDIVRT